MIAFDDLFVRRVPRGLARTPAASQLHARVSYRPPPMTSPRLRPIGVCLVTLVGCGRATPDASKVPVTLAVKKITPGERYEGVIDAEVDNRSDQTLVCYELRIEYRDAQGARLKVDVGRGHMFELMSLSGGWIRCDSKQTCPFTVKGLTIPAKTASASLVPVMLKTYNAAHTRCANAPLYEAPRLRFDP